MYPTISGANKTTEINTITTARTALSHFFKTPIYTYHVYDYSFITLFSPIGKVRHQYPHKYGNGQPR